MPVFAFHGTPGSRLQIAIEDSPIRAAGVRLVCPDRPGYGLSTFQPGRRLVDWPRDVAHLADHLGIDRFAVMGISGGGPHSAVCAALIGDRVTSAAIVSGVGPLADPRATEGMMRSNRILTALSRRRSRVLHVVFNLQVGALRRWPSRA
jgi:pimeloyl-ACP methyl ester carboxylesterase